MTLNLIYSKKKQMEKKKSLYNSSLIYLVMACLQSSKGE